MPDQQPSVEDQQKAALAHHQREVGEIIDLGRTEFGTDTFDDSSRAVADAMGDRTQEFLALSRQFDQPHRLINDLAQNPDELQRLSKMPSARLITEFARMEARAAPHGHVSTGVDPAWKGPAMRGRVSDRDWKHSFGSQLSDEAWNKEFDRRNADKRRR